MNEQEWLACDDAERMLNVLYRSRRYRVSDRKLTLFACACCRRIWHLLFDERSKKAVEITERVVDRLATVEEVATVFEEAERAAEAAIRSKGETSVSAGGSCAVRETTRASNEKVSLSQMAPIRIASRNAFWTEFWSIRTRGFSEDEQRAILEAIKKEHSWLFHDIAGNPFRPNIINPAWLTWNDGTVRRIAQSIYEERGFNKMPILADALTDAGCDDEDILNHCRSDEAHVRGCWVLDLALGKE